MAMAGFEITNAFWDYPSMLKAENYGVNLENKVRFYTIDGTPYIPTRGSMSLSANNHYRTGRLRNSKSLEISCWLNFRTMHQGYLPINHRAKAICRFNFVFEWIAPATGAKRYHPDSTCRNSMQFSQMSGHFKCSRPFFFFFKNKEIFSFVRS